ncbi:HAD-IIA family hydrolase [Glaciihabitans arcticus]|uniref:HAD-IIA family hydrolase n=1 Tax=Glaciihabitans arcticus TaxID=2668039 RepID=A0A4Q9GVF3_9MICO|nr:HAD-IIA family hydrolase [Glaciihabitans arcticus]TBN56160.1 HAD-IIA family hydrolase [Glaciihabitans arcticus]
MTDSTPLDGVDLVLADLDGVVYRGPDAIPFAVDSLNTAAETIRVGYLTNNASRTAASVAEHLTGLGLSVKAEDVVTSPQAAMRVLKELVPAGSTILVVGGDGLTDELEKAGFGVTRSALDKPAAVIQGFAPDVGWVHLAEAAFALNVSLEVQIPWVATNTDWTIPQARGTAPGNGTLVSAVHTAVGRLPVVAGKPEVPMFELASERFSAEHPLVIGDRLDTDILGANRAGFASVHVLTGIDQPKQLLAAAEDQRPTFIVEDLRQLHEPYPATIETKRGESVVITVGDCVLVRTAETIVVEQQGSAINRLRAGTATIWNSGYTIYALRVPPELYS